jgi:predicted nucleic acid-binding protein
VFDDEREQLPDALLDRIAACDVVVPCHWILEVTNGLLLAARRGRLRRPDEDIEILERLGTLAIRVDPETATHGWRETAFLARSLGLTTYDAAYLELAMRLPAPLATLDRELLMAARTMGIALAVDDLPASDPPG